MQQQSMKKRKSRIAFVHPDLGIGGAERLVLDVANVLWKQGHEVQFITNHFDSDHSFDELKYGQFPVVVYGDWIPRTIYGKFHAFCAFIRMVYLIVIYLLVTKKKDKADIYFVDLIPIAIPFLKIVNERVIYYCHHPDLLSSEPGGFLKRLYRKPMDYVEYRSTSLADILLVNSYYTASVFRETFPQIKKPIQVVYPTIAYSYQEMVKKMTPRPIHEIIEDIPSNNSFVFLSINRFHPAKLLEMAIMAFDELKTKVKDSDRIYLILAGGYDPQNHVNHVYYTKLKKIVKLKGLEKQIIFIKSPPDDTKTELLLSCDCVLYTPIKEHFGIVPLEAMAAGKPVIAVNSGGPRETIEHGVNGFLAEPNPSSMAENMARIMEKSTAKEFGIKGRKVLHDKFSYEMFSKTLARVIREAELIPK